MKIQITTFIVVLTSAIVLADCGGSSSDENSAGEAADVSSLGATGSNAKRIFVSSTSHTGNMGGLAGADRICQNLADAARLGGTWKAYLSTATSGAKNRMPPASPWLLANTEFAAFDSTNAIPLARIDFARDENGAIVPETATVHTAANNEGRVYNPAQTCANWTTTAGTVRYGVPRWSDLDPVSAENWGSADNGPCATARRLYCFEV